MTRPLRIALAVNRFAPSTGGIETHVDRLSVELADRGHEVTVLTHDHWCDRPAAERRGAVTVRRFAPVVRSRHAAVSPALGRHLAAAAGTYDLVHAHGYHDTPAAVAAWTWPGPLVFTPHYHGSSESTLRNLVHVPYRLVGRRIVRRAARIICVSGAEADLFTRRFTDADDKVEVISNGVDVERLRRGSVITEPDGRAILLAAGRLDHYKQVDRIVEAMSELRRDFVLEVTGDGPARPDLERLVDRLRLGDTVRLRGRVPDETLATLLRSACCLVSMSTHEAQGIVLLEALAVRTRVLASAIPAHVDVCRRADGAVHLVAPDATPRTLAAAIRDAAVQPAPDVFVPTWSEVALQTELAYERALGATRRAVRVGPGRDRIVPLPAPPAPPSRRRAA